MPDKEPLKWDDVAWWVREHAVLTAFLISFVFVVLVIIAFFLHWLAGTLLLCGTAAVCLLAAVIWSVIDG